MNVLITSAGRRTYMVDYFREALSGESHVIASNSEPSPALYRADAFFLTPLIYDDDYIPFLLAKCREYHIDLLISLFDIDLPILARNKSKFDAIGVKVAISDEETLSKCNDKYAMYLHAWKNSIRVPECELSIPDALLKVNTVFNYPLMIKPRYGMGSIAMYKVFNKRELLAAYDMCKREVLNSYLRFESKAEQEECVLIEQIIEGTEYGLDVICNLDGKYETTIVRKKLAMRSGETDEAIVLTEDSLETRTLRKLGEDIAIAFKPKGLIDVDVIMNLGNMLPYVIDINARFGGGYPFSHLSGVNAVKAYIYWALGDEEKARECLNPTKSIRAYKDIIPVAVREDDE